MPYRLKVGAEMVPLLSIYKKISHVSARQFLSIFKAQELYPAVIYIKQLLVVITEKYDIF